MMNKPLTFSHQVKDELSGVPCLNRCCQQAEIAAAFLGAARFAGQTMTLATAHPGCAARLTELIRRRYQADVHWQAGRELMSLTIGQPALYRAIIGDLQELFSFDIESSMARLPDKLPVCCRQAILRALFLVCGSISKPAAAYHLEFSIRRTAAALLTADLLDHLSIRTGLLRRHGYHVIYIREGQFLADFLLQTGAHHSLLAFESLRVEKEMRNTVNRVVNCDSANTQRVANASARQLEMIRKISDQCGLGILPPNLQQVAELRLANPDLSLTELGQLMQPPLGKSGMNHRLIRLERLGADLMPERKISADGT